MALTQAGVLDYLLARGGRVKNAELVCAFTRFVNCPEATERKKNRDLFKSFINNVAVVKPVGEVKYVVVKKRYQPLIKAGGILGKDNGMEEKSPDAPPSCILNQSSSAALTDDSNHNCFCTSSAKSIGLTPDLKDVCDTSVPPTAPTAAKVLNIGTRLGKNATVFAVVAQKSPPHYHPERMDLNQNSAAQQGSLFADNEKVLSPENPKRSPRNKRRLSLVPSQPAPKRGNGKAGLEAKDAMVIPLEPFEHKWLVYSAAGRWSQLYSLLLQDAHLVEKRSFLSGFSCLHWAAKHGNANMVRNILAISRDAGARLNINCRSRDGYTPLHVAAIHGHESVLKILVLEYGANLDIRDNSGKKAYHYLCKDSSPQVRELLGDPHAWAAECRAMCLDTRESIKGVNTISRLLKAGVGDRKKSRRRQSFH